MKKFEVTQKEASTETGPKKKYRIGGHVHYEENMDHPVGLPHGITIEAYTQEEAEKRAKEMCEGEASHRYNGSVAEFWAEEIKEDKE